MLAEFDFVVRYQPGNKNGKTNALSRRWDLRPEKGSQDLQLVHFSFKPGQLRISAMKAIQLRDPFRNILLSTAKKDKTWLATRDAVVAKKEGLDPYISIENEVLLWKGRWYILDDIDQKNMILHNNHDSKIAGHFGIYQTLERLKHNYHWHRMEEDIKDYVQACDTCQRDKLSRHRRYGQLEPLEVSYQPWSSISMDWIVDLPESNGYTQIWVIVDRFTKIAHLIPLPTKVSAKDIAKIFPKEIWKTHGLPTDIVSGRDTKITSHFWQVLMDLLGIKTKLSTAFHPETDRQTERVNQTIEQYLRHYCSRKQDDWDELLPMAEFAYNSAKTETTGIFPFEAHYGMLPRQSWEPRNKTPYINPASKVLENVWNGIWERLRENILKAQVRMARWHDFKHGKQPQLKVGDLVMVDKRNIGTQRPSKKLDHKKASPFPITKVVGKRPFRVQLPEGSQAHPTFHVQPLELYRVSREES